MDLRIVSVLGVALCFGAGLAFAGPATNQPDPFHGKELAQQLCANCHLVDNQQQQANADVPSFNEIANKEGQTAGAIMAHIMLPKHPMPTIPLTQSELADLAVYILSMRKSGSTRKLRPMKHARIWYIIADGGRARFVERDETGAFGRC